MTETPERIWARPLPVKVVCYGEYDLDDESGGEEYVHRSFLDDAVKALEECEAEIDDYVRQEYPGDHPVHERYRQRDFSANPARIALAKLRSKT